MSQERLAALRSRGAAVEAQYETHFAGQPRITRDPALLERLIAELRTVADQAAALPASADRNAVQSRAREQIGLYTAELAAIRKAQDEGPEAIEAHYLIEWSRFTFQRYRRHFAGQSRSTRDLGLLAEMIADLKRIKAEMEALLKVRTDTALTEMRDRVDQNLQLYLDERGEIVVARGAGTPEQQSDVLASIANDQFALYGRHFAGKSRLSRRPGLLQRIIDNLDVIRDRMETVRDGGLDNPNLGRNIQIVNDRATFYRGELEAIRTARREATMADLVSALGGAANEVFDEYRANFAGHDRRTRDLARLGHICEALYEVGRQMDELDRARPDDTNSTNLGIVLDTLRLYEREYELIQEAQQGNA
jgi:hypothetical protein